MANVKNLRTGFTGELEQADGLAARARQAAGYVKEEAGAVTRSAQEHPSATGTALLVFGAAAFIAGYLIGSGSVPERSRHWYWDR